MIDRKSQPDRLEDLIAEVQRAEDAGVFRRTPVDPAALIREAPAGSRPRPAHRLFIGLQAAACIALVVGALSLWYGGNSSQDQVGNSSGADVTSVVTAPRADIGVLAQCFTGPADGALPRGCESVDFDADGDVDLADYGAFQRAYTPGP